MTTSTAASDAVRVVVGAIRLYHEMGYPQPDRIFISKATLVVLNGTAWFEEMRVDGRCCGYLVLGFDAGEKMMACCVHDGVIGVHEELRARIVERFWDIARDEHRLRLMIEKRWCATAKNPPLVPVGPWLPLTGLNDVPMVLETAVVNKVILPSPIHPDLDRHLAIVE